MDTILGFLVIFWRGLLTLAMLGVVIHWLRKD